MPEQTVEVRRVDFNNPRDIADHLGSADAYARDPMGAGRPPPTSVRDRPPGDLAVTRVHAARWHGTVPPLSVVATCFSAIRRSAPLPLLNIHDIAVFAPDWRGALGRTATAVDD